MTVAELIARLSAFPPDALVVTSGFDEFGLDDVGTVEWVDVGEEHEKDSTAGGLARYGEPEHGQAPCFRAVMIDR